MAWMKDPLLTEFNLVLLKRIPKAEEEHQKVVLFSDSWEVSIWGWLYSHRWIWLHLPAGYLCQDKHIFGCTSSWCRWTFYSLLLLDHRNLRRRWTELHNAKCFRWRSRYLFSQHWNLSDNVDISLRDVCQGIRFYILHISNLHSDWFVVSPFWHIRARRNLEQLSLSLSTVSSSMKLLLYHPRIYVCALRLNPSI